VTPALVRPALHEPVQAGCGAVMNDARSLFFGLAGALAGISGVAGAIAVTRQSSQPSAAEMPVRQRLRARLLAHPWLVTMQLACLTVATALVVLALAG
jgi:hypothetical protein